MATVPLHSGKGHVSAHCSGAANHTGEHGEQFLSRGPFVQPLDYVR
jgi:hypothetical protein